MNSSFPQFGSQNFGAFNASNMMHQTQASIVSAYAADSAAPLKLLYNPLFPSGYVGYAYKPFSTDWISENSRFVYAFAKLHSYALTGVFFKGQPITNKVADKSEKNQYNLPTFKADCEYDIAFAYNAAVKLSCLFQTIYSQWFGKRILDNTDYKQIREKLEGRAPEIMLLNLMHMQMLLLIYHKEAQLNDSAVYPSIQNSDLQALLCRIMMDYTKCNFVFYHYYYIVRVDSQQLSNYFFVPRIEKAMLHHFGIRNHLLNKLYFANILRSTGQLSDALKELLQLLKLSMPPPGACFLCEAVSDQYVNYQDCKVLNDFPDVRVPLILTLLACGYGADCEQFILNGCYVQFGDYNYFNNNYCRCSAFFDDYYRVLSDRGNFPENADRSTVSQSVAEYQNALHMLHIKCPYACCSVNRNPVDLVEHQELYFIDDSLSYRYTISDSIRYTPDDEYMSQCGVSSVNSYKVQFSTCCYMSGIPHALSQPERYQTTYFYANLIAEPDFQQQKYTYTNYQLPMLVPHSNFKVSEMDVQRKSIEKIMAKDRLTPQELPEVQLNHKAVIKRLSLQHHSGGLLSYDSYNCLVNQTYFLHNYTYPTDFESKDFYFVLQSFVHSQYSAYKFTEILLYGQYFNFELNQPRFAPFPTNKPRATGLKSSGQQAFDLTATTALYTLLLLQISKRTLWANRVAKEITKSLALSACPCGIGQAYLPHFFGVKALIWISHYKEKLNYLDYFLVDFPQPPDIDAALLQYAFESNSFLPLYLLGIIPLPDVGILRYMTHLFTVEEYQFYRTPYHALSHQESKQMQAILYAADFGHFWRADEYVMRRMLANKLSAIGSHDGIPYLPQLPPCLFFIREAFDAFLQCQLLQQVLSAAQMNAQYYYQCAMAVALHEKEEAYTEAGIASGMSSNHLLVPQSFVNLQNLNMSKANLYGMIFEKRLQVQNKPKDDFMTVLNLNHGYINMQRNLTRVMGSLLQQVGDLEVSQLIQFVLNQVLSAFTAQPSGGASFYQYFSLDLYNIIIQQIAKIAPDIADLQEQPKPTTKSVKKGKKDYKKKDAREFVAEQENVRISEDDAVWRALSSNSGLLVNFALNQTLRQTEILRENQQFIIYYLGGQKAPQKLMFQSITGLTYSFEMLLGQYFYLKYRSVGTPFERVLTAAVSLYGVPELYAIYLAQMLSFRDFAVQPRKDAQTYAAFTGNAAIPEADTCLGVFWTATDQILHLNYPSDVPVQGAKNVIFARVPDNLSQYGNARIDEKRYLEWGKTLYQYVGSGMIRLAAVQPSYGRVNTMNALSLAVLSGSAALVYLQFLHFYFSAHDLFNGMYLACLSANPHMIRLMLNYQAPGFERGSVAARLYQINTTRKRHNAQNYGHQLPLMRTDVSGTLAAKICDIQQVLTAYFADKQANVGECYEPMYFSTQEIVAVQDEYERAASSDKLTESTQTTPQAVLRQQSFPLKPEGPNSALRAFSEISDVLQHSKHIRFILLYYAMANNSKFCTQNSCYCCKIFKKALIALSDIAKPYVSMFYPDKCVVQMFVQRKLAEVTSNFTALRKNVVPQALSRHVQQCVQLLTAQPNFGQYIIMKRGKAINLTQLKLENTSALRLAELSFIPLTTPLTLACQLYSEALDELLIQYKRDLQDGVVSRAYLNHKDGLGLTAINHCTIVFCSFAAKMLKYQAEIDEYQRYSGKAAAFSEEMRNIKAMFRYAQYNLVALLYNGANTFIQDNAGLTPRDRVVLLMMKHKICTIDDGQMAVLGKNTELVLNYFYFQNDGVVKAQVDQFGSGSKKIVTYYSTAADTRYKQKFYTLGNQLSYQLRLKDVSIGFDLYKYKCLLQTEIGDLDFAKPVYEALATVMHYFGVEEQPADYNAYCVGHQAESADIYAQIPRYITVGAPVISYCDFERFERGEDYSDEKVPENVRKWEKLLISARGCLNFICQDAPPPRTPRPTRQAPVLHASSCASVMYYRVAYRLWRAFDASRSGVNILRAGKNVLNSVNFVTRNEKAVSRQRTGISDDDALYMARKSSNRCCFIAQIVNKASQCQISLTRHPRAIALDECAELAELFRKAYTHVCPTGGSAFYRQFAKVIVHSTYRPSRTLASTIGNSEAVNARLFSTNTSGTINAANFGNSGTGEAARCYCSKENASEAGARPKVLIK